MIDFNLSITITDIFCCGSNTCRVEKDYCFTSPNQTASLQCNYLFSVLSVTDQSATILIQNGIYTFIRVVFFEYETKISLPTKNGTHIVMITIRQET